jgi:hypothetical protein
MSKAAPQLSFEALMQAVPVRNTEVRAERRGPNGIVLYVPLRRRWFNGPPISWVLPLSPHRAVGLDRLGLEVWEACDGRTATEAIVERFADRHGLSFHEARTSVVAFLQQLTARRMIVVVGSKREESAN